MDFLEIHAWICYGFSDQGSQLSQAAKDVTQWVEDSTSYIFSASRLLYPRVSAGAVHRLAGAAPPFYPFALSQLINKAGG